MELYTKISNSNLEQSVTIDKVKEPIHNEITCLGYLLYKVTKIGENNLCC